MFFTGTNVRRFSPAHSLARSTFKLRCAITVRSISPLSTA